MPEFRYRLATLLQLRRSVRDERRVELAEVQRADAELEERLTQVLTQENVADGQCRVAASPGDVDVPRLAEARQYAAALRADEAKICQQRRTLAAEIDRRREALVQADREVQTLEKLRENQLAVHHREEGRREGRRLDEIALRTAVQ